MKQVFNFLIYVIIIVVLFLTSCKKELSCESCRIVNQAPTANAGKDTTIALPFDSVLLDGRASTDPDGTITSYKWTKIVGPVSSNIVNTDLSKTMVGALAEGVYKFELIVTDNGGLTAKDTVQVTVDAAAVTCGNGNRALVNAQLIPVGTLSIKRSAIAVASAGNKILFAGGTAAELGDSNSSRVDIYDITANTWSTAELSRGRSYGIAALSVGDKIFFAGGQASDGTVPTNVIDIYNTSSNTWTVDHLSLGGENIAATTVGDKVIFAGGMGGFSGGIERSKRVDIYHLTTNTWTTAALSDYKIDGHNAVTVNNKVYISGGFTGDWSNHFVSNKIDIYDNVTNTWSTAAMGEGRSYHAAIVAGNNIYWAGGNINKTMTSYVPTCSVEIMNAGTGSSKTQYLHSPGRWWICAGQNAVLKNNKIIFFTGGSRANKFDIYDITTGLWSIGILPIDIGDASIISVNNSIYIAGGIINGVLSNKVWKLEF